MFKKTTITMTLAAIATVAVNLQAPVFASEPSTEPVVTETPGLPGFDSFTMTAPTLEEALEDYLAGLGPGEGDSGGPADVAELPDGVIDANPPAASFTRYDTAEYHRAVCISGSGLGARWARNLVSWWYVSALKYRGADFGP
jgi:hypothetical protein